MSAEIETRAGPDAVWELWENPERWKDWNGRIATVRLDGPLAMGTTARIRFTWSLPLKFTITALEPRRSFTDEARLPGVRLGHEHVLEPGAGATKIRNRLYLDGSAERIYALIAGRQMQASVREFVQKERMLAEASAR